MFRYIYKKYKKDPFSKQISYFTYLFCLILDVIMSLFNTRAKKKTINTGGHTSENNKTNKKTHKKHLKKRDTYKYLRKNMLQTRKNVKPPTLNTHNSKTTHMFPKKKNVSFSHD